jgi:hypothetical protein
VELPPDANVMALTPRLKLANDVKTCNKVRSHLPRQLLNSGA